MHGSESIGWQAANKRIGICESATAKRRQTSCNRRPAGPVDKNDESAARQGSKWLHLGTIQSRRIISIGPWPVGQVHRERESEMIPERLRFPRADSARLPARTCGHDIPTWGGLACFQVPAAGRPIRPEPTGNSGRDGDRKTDDILDVFLLPIDLGIATGTACLSSRLPPGPTEDGDASPSPC